MRVVARFGWLSVPEVGQSVFDAFLDLFPGMTIPSARVPTLRIKVPVDDARYLRARQILLEAGWAPRKDPNTMAPNRYVLKFVKEFEVADYEAATFLEPIPPPDAWFGEYDEKEDGQLCVKDYSANREAWGKPIIGVLCPSLIVSSTVRDALAHAELTHLTFREAILLDLDFHPMPWPGEQYWQLTSDLQLPSPQPFAPRRFDTAYPYEKHFRQADLQGLPAFDLAITSFEIEGRAGRDLVASKAFYRVCVEHGFPMNWTPVHVDD